MLISQLEDKVGTQFPAIQVRILYDLRLTGNVKYKMVDCEQEVPK